MVGSSETTLTRLVVVIFNTIHALIMLHVLVQVDWDRFMRSLTLVDNLSERQFASSLLIEIS